jgi:drug/metabolite transporter (DMT)-like permease
MKRKVSVLFILLAGALWGSSCLFVHKLTEMGFSPMHCTAIRILCGAVLLNVALIVKGRGLRLYKISFPSLCLAAASGLFSVLAMCISYYVCMTETSAAVSAILLYTAPVFVMIMSALFFKEKITGQKLAAFCVAIAGCALVSGIASGAEVSPRGILFGVLSGFAYSLYGIFTTFYMKRNTQPLTFTTLSFTFAAVGALVLTDLGGLVQVASQADSLPRLLLLAVGFSLCTAVLPYAFYTIGLSGVRPDVASILAFSEPLTAAVLGIVVLKQPFDGYQGIGICLVIVAILLLNIRWTGKAKRHAEVTPPPDGHGSEKPNRPV